MSRLQLTANALHRGRPSGRLAPSLSTHVCRELQGPVRQGDDSHVILFQFPGVPYSHASKYPHSGNGSPSIWVERVRSSPQTKHPVKLRALR